MTYALSVHKHPVTPDILHEDDDIIVVNKPAGMLAQDDSTGRISLSGIVAGYLKGKVSADDPVYCAAMHRLDRPVSGVMLFAKNAPAAGRLSGDIKDRKTGKFYCAIVSPAPGVLPPEQWIELHQFYIRRRDRAYIADENDAGAVPVSLRYRFMCTAYNSGLVLVELITGRRHQIRVQLSSIGLPVAGDRFYGSGETVADGIISLHAHYLCFTHPVTRCPMIVSAPLPRHMTDRIGIYPDIKDYFGDQEFTKSPD